MTRYILLLMCAMVLPSKRFQPRRSFRRKRYGRSSNIRCRPIRNPRWRIFIKTSFRMNSVRDISSKIRLQRGNYLRSELASYQEITGPVAEPTGWKGNYVRVNLSVLKSGKVPYDVFFSAFVRVVSSASHYSSAVARRMDEDCEGDPWTLFGFAGFWERRGGDWGPLCPRRVSGRSQWGLRTDLFSALPHPKRAIYQKEIVRCWRSKPRYLFFAIHKVSSRADESALFSLLSKWKVHWERRKIGKNGQPFCHFAQFALSSHAFNRKIMVKRTNIHLNRIPPVKAGSIPSSSFFQVIVPALLSDLSLHSLRCMSDCPWSPFSLQELQIRAR